MINKNKIVVTGGNGRFAQSLKKIRSKYKFVFPTKKHLDITNLKSIRKFFPNLKNVTFKSDILKRNIRLNVSNSALRTVDYKGGLDFYLKSVRSFKLSLKAKKLKNKIIAKA